MVEWKGEVEDLARIDFAFPDQLDQVGQEPPDWSGAAVQMDAGEEQVDARDRDVVVDADEAHVAAGASGADGLHGRFMGADGLDHRVRPEPAGEFFDLRHALVAAFGDDVGRAVEARQLLPVGVTETSR